jgi:hypothetical protein
MLKKIAVVTALAAALALSLAVLAVDADKTPATKPCPKMAHRGCCAMKAQQCPHQADMQAAVKALEEDLAKMEKGIPAADQAAFLKEHQANLKKFFDTRAACQKECKMKMQQKEAPKEAPKAEAKTDAKG